MSHLLGQNQCCVWWIVVSKVLNSSKFMPLKLLYGHELVLMLILWIVCVTNLIIMLIYLIGFSLARYPSLIESCLHFMMGGLTSLPH